jgi:opacity protein-like surface antigen
MKKVLSVLAASAFVFTAGVALAGGPGQKVDDGCPEACQQQIDDLNSSQAQQNEQLGAHGAQLENHEGRISSLEKGAIDPWFVRLGARAAWVNQKTEGQDWNSDIGWGGAIAFGRQFGNFRAELEYAYQGTDLEDREILDGDVLYSLGGDIKVTTVMANGYYEMPVFEAFSLYAMAGLGYAKYDVDYAVLVFDPASDEVIGTASAGGSDNVFAYKAGVGMTYDFTDQIAGDLGYEYLGVADTDLADSINGHNVVASVRFKF